MSRDIGYFWVKFYNYIDSRIMYWNGKRFEAFESDFVNDEIESIDERRVYQEIHSK